MPEHTKEEEDVIFKNGNEIQSINGRALNAYPEKNAGFKVLMMLF